MTDAGEHVLRQTWQRAVPALSADQDRLRDVLAQVVPAATLRDVAPLSGGLANTNLRLSLNGEPRDLVLRLYQRDPQQMMKEAAIAARLIGRVPVAAFLHVEPDPQQLGAPFALLEWVDGVTLDSVLPELDAEQLDAVGETLGRLLATMHGEHFSEAGFLDGTLHVCEPIETGGAGLIDFCTHYIADSHVRTRLGKTRLRRLQEFVEQHAHRLDAWRGKPCLTHGDFGGSNILVSLHDKQVGVAAVLDWEFAFAGSPFFDLGNLTRAPLGDSAEFSLALERGYRDVDSDLPGTWQDLARLVDLTAWIDFAARPAIPDSVLETAHVVIDTTIGDANG